MFKSKLMILIILLIPCVSYTKTLQKANNFDYVKFISQMLKSEYAVTDFNIIKSSIRYNSEKINVIRNCPTFEKIMKKYKKMDMLELKALRDDPVFGELEKISLKNTACGGQASDFLLYVYALFGQEDKASATYRRLISFANTGNFAAIRSICVATNHYKQPNQTIRYCKQVLNSKNPNNNEVSKEFAIDGMADAYSKTKQISNLIKICKQAPNILKDASSSIINCNIDMQNLADELYKNKQYKQALDLYKQSVLLTEKSKSQFVLPGIYRVGFSQQKIADMYLRGEGTKINYDNAILWYKKAQQLQQSNNTYLLNNMGVTYYNIRNYIAAFECYQIAATMGYSLSQLNLAIMYFHGKGTIQDYKQAFAWASVAAAKGLNDADNQKATEQLRDGLESILSRQSKIDLKQAKSLAQTYYNKYVLNKAD